MKIALEHRTTYTFDRPVGIGPHVIRLRPAPHARTPISAYSLRIAPREHFLSWQQDPFGNHLARAVFPTKASELEVTVGLVADLRVVNPFDFFLEPYAERYPFGYPDPLASDLEPYLRPVEDSTTGAGPVLTEWLNARPSTGEQSTLDFLVELNRSVFTDVAYSSRLEPGVQSPDQTLARGIGSCRDSSWLLVAALRHFGLAARFVSGYLVQLATDESGPAGPGGVREDLTDLHAWAEAFLPGAGWIGMDPTSALFAGEGHIPLAATPHPAGAAPITGATEPCEVTFSFSNSIRRIDETPRVSRPYSPEQVEHLHRLGMVVDERLKSADLALTMGGEPTFVSMDDQIAPEWTTAADGAQKRELAARLAEALRERYAANGLIQHGEGTWYPGESRPRWQIGLYWRADGVPLWREQSLLADPSDTASARADAVDRAAAYARAVVEELGLPISQCMPCYEDPLARLAADLALPEGPPADPDPTPDPAGLGRLDAAEAAAGWVVPLIPAWWDTGWASPGWRTRRGRLVLVPGEGPAGTRLPLSSVTWTDPEFRGEDASHVRAAEPLPSDDVPLTAVGVDPVEVPGRTALVVEPRGGFVHVFLPPLERLEQFCALVRLLNGVAGRTQTPLVLEGYSPPTDPRLKTLLVTPDPGVVEVNLPPVSSWPELAEQTTALYDLARQVRLGGSTFGLDGQHSGTGGGSHLTLGGATPAASPLLCRPDLLVSMITYWQHHPALSYLFSGRFVGATSQAPRVDEGRPENLYELEIAFAEIADLPVEEHRPWAVDRALRSLLTDVTGNTHRSEFCIDKLYSPDAEPGRMGLLELRAFEMAPHPEMALVQALLVRSLVARLAEHPFSLPLVRWGPRLHERFLLPHFCAADLAEVVADLHAHDLDVDLAWFDPFLHFRFPQIGSAEIAGVELELRSALEPWPVLAGEVTSGATSRYVDSSVERIQVKVRGLVAERQAVTVNGLPLPLAPTGTPGEGVAGVRYKAWKPWSARHPGLGIDAPLTVEVIDLASEVSLGGVTYHVTHPGGRSYDRPPVNATEAEARRAGRFEPFGHTPGRVDADALQRRLAWRSAEAGEYPLTLDLRRRVASAWGRP